MISEKEFLIETSYFLFIYLFFKGFLFLNFKEVFKKMQFIEKHQDGKYYVTASAKLFLEQITTPISVVSVSGPYRSGKSSLLNILATNTFPPEEELFGTSSSTSAKTFGLWISPRLLDNRVLLLDSEGLGSTASQVDHDLNIIALSMILSSVFIYNSPGPINTTTIGDLSIASKVSKLLTGKNNIFKAPELIWVARDFSLELVDTNADDYLHHCLQEATDLQTLFVKKCCVLLPRPSSSMEDLRTYTNYSPEFLTGIARIRLKMSIASDRVITGPVLISMAESFVSQINSGVIPSLDDIWTAAKKASKYTASTSSIELFKTLSLTDEFDLQTVTELAVQKFLSLCFEPSITDVLDIQHQLGKEATYVQHSTLQHIMVECGYEIDTRRSFSTQLQYFLSRIRSQQQELTTENLTLKTDLHEKDCEMIIKVSELKEQTMTVMEELEFERTIANQLRHKVSTISNTLLEHQHLLKRAVYEKEELLVDNEFLTTTVQTKIKETQARETDQLVLLEKSEAALCEKEALLLSVRTSLLLQEKEQLLSKKTIADMEGIMSELKSTTNTELAVLKNMLTGEQERSRKRQCREENVCHTQDGKIVWLEERYMKDSSKICTLEKELATMRRTLMIAELK